MQRLKLVGSNVGQSWTIARPHWSSLVLGMILLMRLVSLIWIHQTELLNPFDIQSAETAYTHSQYNLGEAEFYGNIEDDLLYSYAGSQYIRGTDPSTINSEVPFLVKYLYGASIIMFGNAVIIQMLMAVLLLISVAWLTGQITQSIELGFTASLLLSLDPLFTQQMFTTMLDLPQALFVVVTFISYYYARASEKDWSWWLVGVCLGLVATSKLWITAGILYVCLGIALRQSHHSFISRELIRITLGAGLFYLVTHLVFFAYHPNLGEFILLHLDTLRLYRSYVPEYPPGELLRIIFLGQWQTWWGDWAVVSVDKWSVVWPMVTLGTVYGWWRAWVYKQSFVLVMASFCLLYLGSNLTHLVFPRYLLTILPLMVSISLWSIGHCARCTNVRIS